MHCRVFCNISGLYPLNASSTFFQSRDNQKCFRHCQMSRRVGMRQTPDYYIWCKNHNYWGWKRANTETLYSAIFLFITRLCKIFLAAESSVLGKLNSQRQLGSREGTWENVKSPLPWVKRRSAQLPEAPLRQRK